MTLDSATAKQLLAWFRPLNTVGAAKAFPAPLTLANELVDMLPNNFPSEGAATEKLTSHFMTAAVDIWLRSVHSFLVSTALTGTSPVWASVSGYYSSHYAVRGIGHLLGYFLLFRKKRVAKLKAGPNGYQCEFLAKQVFDHEHKYYWKLVKQDTSFRDNIFFTENPADTRDSDIGHRNFANYADHLGTYPSFAPLNEQALIDRIDHISKIPLDAPPIPRMDRYPDVEYVQLIAYHRLIAFRSFVDEILVARNKFWNVHRTPAFARDYMNFQLAESAGLAQLGS